MNIVDSPSPNFASRNGVQPDMLVLHYTGMKSAAEALARMRDPQLGIPEKDRKRVSAHYMVDEDGTIHKLVDESNIAWHAGISSWRGKTDINARSIGIEIVNPGHEFGYRPFTPAQMESVAALSKHIVEKYHIPSWNVVGHSDIAPMRKEDPGELFDWKLLAERGVGVVSSAKAVEEGPFTSVLRSLKRGISAIVPFVNGLGLNVLELQQNLKAIGYEAPLCGTYGEETTKCVTAFQRHFRPEKVDGQWDDQCQSILTDLRARIPSATLAKPDGRTAAAR